MYNLMMHEKMKCGAKGCFLTLLLGIYILVALYPVPYSLIGVSGVDGTEGHQHSISVPDSESSRTVAVLVDIDLSRATRLNRIIRITQNSGSGRIDSQCQDVCLGGECSGGNCCTCAVSTLSPSVHTHASAVPRFLSSYFSGIILPTEIRPPILLS